MTGRRLYDLICDGVASQGSWSRENMPSFPKPMAAWTDLGLSEKRVYTLTAQRLKGVKR